MNIAFTSDKEKKIAENAKLMAKHFGKQAKEIQKRLMQFDACDNMKHFAFDRPHLLTWNLAWCIAIDIIHPFRIIIRPIWENINLWDRSTIIDIKIEALCQDYH